jgi:hypothetical protein
MFQPNADLPLNSEADVIATAVLEELGLLYPDVELQGVSVGGSVNGSASHLLVQYRQYKDGIPIMGGTSYGVRVSTDGRLAQLSVWHIELELQGETACITPYGACDRLMAGEGLQFIGYNPDMRIHIDDIYLAYFIEPEMAEGKAVVPVYVFEGECVDTNGKYLQDYREYTPAICE